MKAFVDAFVAELNPGDSVILRQAALDAADKGWRLTRAQRWEAEGYTAAAYASREGTRAEWLRILASQTRREAEAVRLFHDPDTSSDDLAGAFCTLSFAAGSSEEDLDWVDDADAAAVAEALASLIEKHFGDCDRAAAHLDAQASKREAEAEALEFHERPQVVRREIDGSFARNAERLVSHASREYDRALKRYWDLYERYGPAAEADTGQDPDVIDEDDGPASASAAAEGESGPQGGMGGGVDGDDIFSRMSADEVVELLSNALLADAGEPISRNEPTEGSTGR